MSSEKIVIHHGNCTDGFTAAWAFKQLNLGVEATYIPAMHGEAPPPVAGADVYILDFAYPRAILIGMAEQAASLLVLDHHKTAEADLAGLPFCEFDMARSGAGIAWDHFAAGQPRPWLIDIVEDRDLWRYTYGDRTRDTSAFIATLPMTFEAWDALAKGEPDHVAENGKAIRSFIEHYGEMVILDAVFRPVAGQVVPLINISHQQASDHINLLLAKHPEYPFAGSFFLNSQGKWRFSLRSIGEFDVSAIAQHYGGGGHRNAAGFTVDKLPWE
ncbi:MAG: phosphohydrolase [Chloroflexi bacterium]|nr:phosphohydrolase [Chloroflexota bacterium]